MRIEVLTPYQLHLVDLTKDNQFDDALVKLATVINIPSGIHSMPLTVKKRNKLAHCYTIEVYNMNLTA